MYAKKTILYILLIMFQLISNWNIYIYIYIYIYLYIYINHKNKTFVSNDAEKKWKFQDVRQHHFFSMDSNFISLQAVTSFHSTTHTSQLHASCFAELFCYALFEFFFSNCVSKRHFLIFCSKTKINTGIVIDRKQRRQNYFFLHYRRKNKNDVWRGGA